MEAIEFTGIQRKMFAMYGRKMTAEAWWTSASILRWPSNSASKVFGSTSKNQWLQLRRRRTYAYARSHIGAKGFQGSVFTLILSLCVPPHGFSVSGLHQPESEHVASLIALYRTGKREQKAMFQWSKTTTCEQIPPNWPSAVAESDRLHQTFFVHGNGNPKCLVCWLGARCAWCARCALWGRWQQDLDEPWWARGLDGHPSTVQAIHSVTSAHRFHGFHMFPYVSKCFHAMCFKFPYVFLCLRVGGLKLPWGWTIGCWKQHCGVFVFHYTALCCQTLRHFENMWDVKSDALYELVGSWFFSVLPEYATKS